MSKPVRLVRKPRAAGTPPAAPTSRVGELDLHLFNEGRHRRLYDVLGAHPVASSTGSGTHFAVWAPDATRVSVVGDFNEWDPARHPLRVCGSSGIWADVIPEVGPGTLYKYHIASRCGGRQLEKADPFGFTHECPPRTASRVWSLDYTWNDAAWLSTRTARQQHDRPMTIYEVHLGSWQRVPEQQHRWLTYRELAAPLANYVREMGFTHVEFLPIMEHPFYGSWGYQVTGYFAPTSRYGTPQDFMYLIDYLHQHEIGVILDWVPSHFPADGHGLAGFDGTHLYEHADPRQGFHPDWRSCIFNFGRNEVRSFLLSNADFWLERYHIDGLRVDAVASMLYLDYSRRAGEWIPNAHGGNENLAAIDFIRQLSEQLYAAHPGIHLIAEESTAWPMVSRPTYVGGLGFGFKWDMGWMNDTLRYFSKEPVHRKFHHHDLTFRQLYAESEHFVLALSHDEVVHGKGALLAKMPGDDWQKFANLRLLFGYQYAQTGKKLLFMGSEFGQWSEWFHERSLDWHLLAYAPHQGIHAWVRDLNHLYTRSAALFERDAIGGGFEWIDCHDADAGIVSFIRRGLAPDNQLVVVANFTPVPRFGYRVGVPLPGYWHERLNSDAACYGGSGSGNAGGTWTTDLPTHAHPTSLTLTLPPLAILFLERD
ncbi:MAG: 1,4-alpha-glucan branching protein GlgB [Deltaproteobacteria bacterium]|nr:1,4-alpha-glucan branching protein GlgB [Deltaproteobacteria bacterium]